jgi:hypothetical protein
MKTLRRHLSYANVLSTLCLFALLGGGAYAASKLPKNSVGAKQIKANAITSAKVKDGALLATDFKAGQLAANASGPAGPKGAPGAQGDPGEPGTPGLTGETGPSGVVSTTTFAGPIETTTTSSAYEFAGPQAGVTTVGSQRLTGAAMVPIGLNSGGPSIVNLGLCYQSSSGGLLTSFSGNYSVVEVSTVRVSQSVAESVIPGPGTWNVGACVKTETSDVTLNDNDFVNGWVQVTN